MFIFSIRASSIKFFAILALTFAILLGLMLSGNTVPASGASIGEVDFSDIPFFLEASGKMEMDILKNVATSMSRQVHEADSEQRRYLHLSAVFACNFANAMYTASARLLEEHGLSFEAMLPLIDETARKVHTLHPAEAQTGPAVRYDRNVIDKHLAMLDNHPLYKELYELTSRIIHEETLTLLGR